MIRKDRAGSRVSFGVRGMAAIALALGGVVVSGTVSALPFGCSDDFFQTRQGGDGTALLRFPAAVLAGGGVADNVYGALQTVGVNGMGLNPVDGYLYAVRNDAGPARLVRIGTTGFTDVGEIVTVAGQTPALPAAFTPTAGVFDQDGRFYFAGQGGGNLAPAAIYRVDDLSTDVDPGTPGVQLGVAEVYALSAATLNIGDFAFGPDGNLYGASQTTLVQFTLTPGVATVATRVIDTVGAIGSSFMDSSARFFVYENATELLTEVAFSYGPAFASDPVTVGAPVSIAGTPPVPAAASSSDGASCTFFNPEIEVRKSSDPASGTTVAIGDTITYTVDVEIGIGPLLAPLELLDTPDPGLALDTVSAGPFACNDSFPLLCTLPAGTGPGSYALVYTAIVQADAVASVGNVVVAQGGGGPDPQCTDCTTGHPLAPAVSVSKSVQPATAAPGATVVFTVTVSNAAPVPLVDVQVLDPVPAGLVGFDWTCAGAACPNAAGTGAIDELIAALPVAAQVVYTIQAVVAAAPPPLIINQVDLLPQAGVVCMPGSTPPPCQAQAQVTITAGPPPPPPPPPAVPVPVDRPALLLLLGLLLWLGAFRRRQRI